MLEQFITQLPEELTQLKKAIAEDNISAIRATAHSLKTTVAFIGLESSLYPLLNPLEDLEENNYHPQIIAAQFNKLKQLSIQAVQEAIHFLL
jgi:HPt (histidine-containing phosphotransfer) domain-containing protein